MKMERESFRTDAENLRANLLEKLESVFVGEEGDADAAARSTGTTETIGNTANAETTGTTATIGNTAYTGTTGTSGNTAYTVEDEEFDVDEVFLNYRH